MGEGLGDKDVASVRVEGGGQIEMVEHVSYLGSVMSRDGDATEDVKCMQFGMKLWQSCRIAKATRAFGCLRVPIFNNPILSIPTKRAVYKAIVLAVLLYEAETWTLKVEHVRRLTTFHNHCMRTILGVTRCQQWEQRLTSRTLANRFGMGWTIPDIIMDRRLQWLGHLGRMGDERLPKRMLFGELRKKRACHGTKKRWRDQVSGDLQMLGLKENWYEVCQDRKEWSDRCKQELDQVAPCRKRNTCAANSQPQERSFVCVCGRTFNRRGGLTRHPRFCDNRS